jgi:hypothetical protein
MQENYKYHTDRIFELVRGYKPELSKLEEWALRHELSSMAQSIISVCSSSINSLTNEVRYNEHTKS